MDSRRRVWGPVLRDGALLAAAFLLQGLVFPYLPIHGVKPLLLPVVSVGIALYGGGERGAGAGLAAGILCDIALNQPTVQFTVLLTLAGVVWGGLGETVLSRELPAYLLAAGATLGAAAAVQCAAALMGGAGGGWAMAGVALLQTVYSLIFLPPAYLLLRRRGRVSV